MIFDENYMKETEKRAYNFEFDEKERIIDINNVNQLDFLFILKRFIELLTARNIPYDINWIHSTSFIDRVIFGTKGINYETEANDKGFRDVFYSIIVPTLDRRKAVQVLCEILGKNLEEPDDLRIKFGENEKFRVGIIDSGYMDKYKLRKGTMEKCGYNITNNDIDIVEYMIEPYRCGYGEYNLHGCVTNVIEKYYDIMKVFKPTNLSDLAIVFCLVRSVFKDRNVVIESIKEHGIDYTIYSREQLYYLLTEKYGVDTTTAIMIMNSMSTRRMLSETEEIVLGSYGVPAYIIKQMNNISRLHYLAYCFHSVKLAYDIAFIKRKYPEIYYGKGETIYRNLYV